MKKRRIALLLCCFLLIALIPRAFADAADLPRVVDGAGLLSSSEEQRLEGMSGALRDSHKMDAVIVTTNSLDGKSPQNYADDFYDLYGYGVGSNASGVLFLLDMGSRQWYISTCGDAIYALTDYGIQKVGEKAIRYLSDGDYYGCFACFMQELETYFAAYEKGSPIDGYADYSGSYYHGDREETVYYQKPATPNILISAVIGLIAAAITVACMRSAMNTKRPQHSAVDYMQAGSFNLRRQQDMFLYSRVSKTLRQTNSGGGHSGGGSSVHHSSGGHSHGGGGGRF